jgi:glycosyltransferase involved in cell wall biosynthesis
MCDGSENNRNTTIVVVPCFNEANRLDVRAYAEFMAGHPDVSLLFVDDGSTDDTPLVLERLRQRHPKQVSTLRLNTNVGKAEAVRRGIQAAWRRSPKFVGYFDADLAAPLGEIPHLIHVLQTRPGVQLAMGSRVALLGRQIRRSGWRHLLGRVFATAASYVLGLPVYDTQCGAKLFRATPANAELFSRPFVSHWIFDVEILARLVAFASSPNCSQRAEELIYEYPLDHWRDVGDSRLQPWDFAVAARDLMTIYWRYIRRQVASPELATAGDENRTPEFKPREAA